MSDSGRNAAEMGLTEEDLKPSEKLSKPKVDPTHEKMLERSGIEPSHQIAFINFQNGQFETRQLDDDEIEEIVAAANPRNFSWEQPPLQDPAEFKDWLAWRHQDLHTYSDDITPEMMQRAIDKSTELGIELENLTEAQIMLANLSDEELASLKQHDEKAEAARREIKEKPGLLTPEEIAQIHRNAQEYMMEKRSEDLHFAPQALDLALDQLDPAIGHSYDGHGIAKGHDLESLNYLLSYGPHPDLPFHTMNLIGGEGAEAMGAVRPYSGGGFIVLGGPNQQIREGGIQNVLVNEQYYNSIPVLAQKFPQVSFIRADQATYELKAKLAGSTESLSQPPA